MITREKIESVVFEGSIFMYGNKTVAISRQDKKCIVTKMSGADGITENEEDGGEIPMVVFDRLVKEILDLPQRLKLDQDEDGIYVVEDEAETGALEWIIDLINDEGDDVMSIVGHSVSSEKFSELSKSILLICDSFSDVIGFLKNV